MNATDLLLALDIGNTTIECGIFAGEAMLTTWRMTSEIPRTPDEFWQMVVFYCREGGIDLDRLKSLAISSVVPHHTQCFVKMWEERFNSRPLEISAATCPFLKVRYADPNLVGADRLCNAYAGFHYYKGPLVVVDFGTAITLDVVDEDGAYLGGVILPGPITAARALHQRTAQLPQVALDFPEQVIGADTERCIRSGLTWGLVDMVDGLIDRIVRELDGTPQVISTGGLVEPYAACSRHFQKTHKDLVLEGIRLIFERWNLLKALGFGL